MPFISIDSQIFFKSPDQNDPRYGDFFSSENQAPKNAFVLLGYPDDEGTRLNRGRLGSKEAPDAIRKYFYKTTPYRTCKLDRSVVRKGFVDMGNLEITGTLLSRHEAVRAHNGSLFSQDNRVISLGGSHDYGYADGAAFLDAFRRSKKKPVIINFDAHLDCRPMHDGPSSGTPFFRLLSEFKKDFDLFEVGLQSVCNSHHYVEWAQSKGARVFFIDELKKAMSALKSLKKGSRPVFVSVDLDVFSSSLGSGTSNNWPFGMSSEQFLPLFDLVLEMKPKGLGLYEVVPNLDRDQITTKLASSIIHRFIEGTHDQLWK